MYLFSHARKTPRQWLKTPRRAFLFPTKQERAARRDNMPDRLDITRVAILVQHYCGSFGFTRRGRVSVVCACFFIDVVPLGVGAGFGVVVRGATLAGVGLTVLSAGLTFVLLVVVASLSASVGAAFVPASSCCSAAFSSASSSLTLAMADGSIFGRGASMSGVNLRS